MENLTEIPGLVSQGSEIVNDIAWGDEINFVFPDPGYDCTLRLVVKEHDFSMPPILKLELARSGPTPVASFSVTSDQCVSLFPPAVYFYDLLAQSAEDGSFRSLEHGIFTTVETAGSRAIRWID